MPTPQHFHARSWKHKTLQSGQPQPCRSSNIRKARFQSTLQIVNELSRTSDLLLKAFSRTTLAEKKDSFDVLLHASVPGPAPLCPSFIDTTFQVTYFNFSCISTHSSSSLIHWNKAWHSTTQSSSVKGGLHFPIGIFDAFTKQICVPCSSGRKVISASPSRIFRVFVPFVFLVRRRGELWQQNFMHFFQLCQLANGNRCTRIIHRDEGRQSFRKSFLTDFRKAFHQNTELVTVSGSSWPVFKVLTMLSHSPPGTL